MIRTLLSIFLLIHILPGNAQITRQNNDNVVSATLFEVNEVGLTVLLSGIQTSLSGSFLMENYNQWFFYAGNVSEYTRSVYSESEKNIDEKSIAAISEFYQKLSVEAADHLLTYKDVLSRIELYKYTTRFGASKNMKIITLWLNMYLKGGAIQSLKLNVTETPMGYRILNIES